MNLLLFVAIPCLLGNIHRCQAVKTVRYRSYLPWPTYKKQELMIGRCREDQHLINLKFTTDSNGDETWWDLSTDDGEEISSGSNYGRNKEKFFKFCVPDSCYEFVFGDTGGDGIDNMFGYELRVNGIVAASFNLRQVVLVVRLTG